MPSLEYKDRRQFALLWEAGDYDAFGVIQPVDPVEVRVTWISKPTSMIGSTGQLVAVSATATVDRAVSLGAKMWLAPAITSTAAAQYAAAVAAGDPADIMEVVAYNESLDLQGRRTERTVGLARHSDAAVA